MTLTNLVSRTLGCWGFNCVIVLLMNRCTDIQLNYQKNHASNLHIQITQLKETKSNHAFNSKRNQK